MTYLMTALAQNFGELGGETALKATLDLMRFQGKPGENGGRGGMSGARNMHG